MFGNLLSRVKTTEAIFAAAEAALDLHDSTENSERYKTALLTYQSALLQEEAFFSQKSRQKWLIEGDKNKIFFQAAVATKRAQSRCHRMKGDDGTVFMDPALIAKLGVEHFTTQFNTNQQICLNSMVDIFIPTLVSPAQNDLLDKTPTLEEFKKVMDHSSAPGPDGFNGKFYSGISLNMTSLLRFSPSLGERLSQRPGRVLLSSPFRRLRIRTPSMICGRSRFAISVLRYFLDFLTTSFLPSLISPEQSGFVKGRNIHDNILLAYEFSQHLENNPVHHNVIIKLDMTKAYDRLSWLFLIKVLRAFGFHETFVDRIWRLLSNNWYSVLINGKPEGYFTSNRGVKQGDPLSPTLFILAADVLCRAIRQHAMDRDSRKYFLPRRCEVIPCLAYADDFLIFTSRRPSPL